MRSNLLSTLLILLCAACVDRIYFDIESELVNVVVIDGFISDQPGPYKITVNKAYDPESKVSLKVPLSVKRLVLSDDNGNSEELAEVASGVYQTSPTGIQGIIGRAYKIRIELLNGRVYESTPDTLLGPGKVDSVYFSFEERKIRGGSTEYGFNVFFNSSIDSQGSKRFLWKVIGTFRAETTPELCLNPMHPCQPCGTPSCGQCSFCNIAPLCSGIRNYGTARDPRFVRVAPCTCCTCWYNLFNSYPIVNDGQLLSGGRFDAMKAMHIPITRWVFKDKVHVEIRQMSLTQQTFTFWKAIKDQKEANNSLFQPITGKIPSNFLQLEGPPARLEGLFFATAISSKSLFISRNDIPVPNILTNDPLRWDDSCFTLFPNATTTRPLFWID